MPEVLLRTRAKAAPGGEHNRDEKGIAIIVLSSSFLCLYAPYIRFFALVKRKYKPVVARCRFGVDLNNRMGSLSELHFRSHMFETPSPSRLEAECDEKLNILVLGDFSKVRQCLGPDAAQGAAGGGFR